MKFVFAATSLVFASVPLTMARLSATTVTEAEAKLEKQKKKKNDGWRHIIGASITFDHFAAEDPNDSHSVSGKLLMGLLTQAFTEVYTDLHSDWGFVSDAVEIPEHDYTPDGLETHKSKGNHDGVDWWIDYWFSYSSYASWEADCRWCPPDLMLGDGPNYHDFMHDKEKWAKVSTLLCDKLHNTGLHAFAKVANCHVDVGYVFDLTAATTTAFGDTKVGDNAGSGEMGVVDNDPTERMNRHSPETVDVVSPSSMIIHHSHPSQTLDVQVLEESIATAFNNVYKDSPFTLEGIQLRRLIIAPEEMGPNHTVSVQGNQINLSSNTCDDDDHLCLLYFIANLYFTCTPWTHHDCKPAGWWAPPDYDAGAAGMLGNLHNVVESYFCHNLRESGDGAYHDVEGCSIMAYA